jgi:hypothetical protein
MEHADFVKGAVDTHLIEREFAVMRSSNPQLGGDGQGRAAAPLAG